MRASKIELKRERQRPRHGDLVVVAVQLAIEDIENWINRRKSNFTSTKPLYVIRHFRRLRWNAQNADGWLSGNWESILSFKDACELLGQDHEHCLTAVYRRWPFIEIQALRSANHKTDCDDLEFVIPGTGRLMFSLDDVDEESDEDDEPTKGVNDGPIATTKEGDDDARPVKKTGPRTVDRRRKLRQRTDQRTLPWDEEASPVRADHSDDSHVERIECTSGTGV